MSESVKSRPLVAPRADGGVLIDPPNKTEYLSCDAPRNDVCTLVANNLANAILHSRCDLGGQTLGELSLAARRALLAAAKNYTAAYRDVSWVEDRRSIEPGFYLVGHQPELFHPGVWLKNFALDHIARGDNAIPINLIIDNDEARHAAIAVPTGSVVDPRREIVPIDATAPPVAWEERQTTSDELFASFASRVAPPLSSFVPRPFVHDFWPHALAARESTNNLGRILAQARHCVEGDWELETLEVPLSTLCEHDSFLHFTALLLSDLPRFAALHNAQLAAYRQAHRLRSQTHPFPDLLLDENEGFAEAPLWVWSTKSPQRRRLFAKQTGSELQLTDRAGFEVAFRHGPSGDVAKLAAQLASLHDQGIKLRPRAMLTTLYARLVLSDVFIHGIGGAKYDEVTDAVARQWLGLEMPKFITVSGTLRLPISRPAVDDGDLRRLNQQLREIRFHPEKQLPLRSTEDASLQQLMEAKQRWLASPPLQGAGNSRHRGIHDANAAMQPALEPLRQQLLRRREEVQHSLQAEKVLGSREWSFCLFPEETLRPWLLDPTPWGP